MFVLSHCQSPAFTETISLDPTQFHPENIHIKRQKLTQKRQRVRAPIPNRRSKDSNGVNRSVAEMVPQA